MHPPSFHKKVNINLLTIDCFSHSSFINSSTGRIQTFRDGDTKLLIGDKTFIRWLTGTPWRATSNCMVQEKEDRTDYQLILYSLFAPTFAPVWSTKTPPHCHGVHTLKDRTVCCIFILLTESWATFKEQGRREREHSVPPSYNKISLTTHMLSLLTLYYLWPSSGGEDSFSGNYKAKCDTFKGEILTELLIRTHIRNPLRLIFLWFHWCLECFIWNVRHSLDRTVRFGF